MEALVTPPSSSILATARTKSTGTSQPKIALGLISFSPASPSSSLFFRKVFLSPCHRASRLPVLALASQIDHASPPNAPSVRITPAEAARTLTEVCNEGTLCTLTDDGWPLGTGMRFTVDAEGNPVFCLNPSAVHTRHLQADDRCSLHIQMEQPGHRKPQCTLKGRVLKANDDKVVQQLQTAWERRFGESPMEEHCFHVMIVDQLLQSLDLGEEDMWVSGSDYKQASADPLHECAPKIVEDMNRKHWEDIRRFCSVYALMDLEVEEAHMTWVDRLGFDMRVLTRSQEIMEIRIPFSREVSDERDARSSLTMMAQIAWEYERNYNPPELQMLRK